MANLPPSRLGTAAGAAAAFVKHPVAKWPQQAYVRIQAQGWAGNKPPTVVAVLDTTPLSATGGYQKITVVDRNQALGATVLEGFDPITLTLNILLENQSGGCQVTPQPTPGAGLVANMEAVLNWMGGRGVALNGVHPLVSSSTARGKRGPQVVSIANYTAQGKPGFLIPHYLQSNKQLVNAPDWNIIDIEPGDGASNKSGIKTYQHLVLTLQQYSGQGNDERTVSGKVTWHKWSVQRQYNTPLKIASLFLNIVDYDDAQSTAKAILKKNNGKNHNLRTITSGYKLGSTVLIPGGAVS